MLNGKEVFICRKIMLSADTTNLLTDVRMFVMQHKASLNQTSYSNNKQSNNKIFLNNCTAFCHKYNDKLENYFYAK